MYTTAVAMGPNVPFEEVVMTTEEFRKVATPRLSTHEIYKKMATTYAKLEERIIKNYEAKL